MRDIADTNSNPLLTKSFNFAVHIIRICKELQSNNNYLLANQLLRCGTSIGANIREAQASESRADFIHKIKIAAKEIEETEYWLLLLKESNIYIVEPSIFDSLLEVKKIVIKSIVTAKTNSRH
ncbi:MAG TPA: four helix bundle protein [Sphingobacteriaceae bacterium]